MGINRGNKKLLEKLVEISKGKHVSNAFGNSYFLVICRTPQCNLADIPILNLITVSIIQAEELESSSSQEGNTVD